MIFICDDIEQRWARAQCEAQQQEYELAEDLAIQETLGRWPNMHGDFEEIEVEQAPIDWADQP